MSIIFLHIPRTGGTSIQHLLQQKYQMQKVSSRILPEKLTAECYHGHFKYDGRAEKWITFLREPYTRVKSLYNHMKYIDPHLQPNTFFNIIQPNPMCNQLGINTADEAIAQLEKFYFVGEFVTDITKLCKILNIDCVIRHSNKAKLDYPLTMPEGFLTEDSKVWDYFLKTKE